MPDLLRIAHGCPDTAELAALTAVLVALTAQAAAPTGDAHARRSRAHWDRHWRAHHPAGSWQVAAHRFSFHR